MRAHNVLGHAHLPSPPHTAPGIPAQECYCSQAVLKPLLPSSNDSVTLENEADYCMRLRRRNGTRIRARSIVSVVSQNLRCDGDFLQATKCVFLQPQQNLVDGYVDNETTAYSFRVFRL